MDLFEHQAKSLLSRFRIPYAPFFCINTPSDIDVCFKKFELDKAVIKKELQTEGRIVMHKDTLLSQDAIRTALETRLSPEKTPPQEVKVQISINPWIDIDTEYGLSIALDFASGEVLICASKGKEKKYTPILRNRQLYEFQKRALCYEMGIPLNLRDQFFSILDALVSLYYSSDAVSITFHPFVHVYNGKLIVLDVQMTIDDNALYRQKELSYFEEKNRVQQTAWQLKKKGISFYTGQGTIGCITNGGALLAATDDLIRSHNKELAIGIDIGKDVDAQKITEGMNLIAKQPNVHNILVNLFCGLSDPLPPIKALVQAMKDDPRQLPVILRLEAASLKSVRDFLEPLNLPIHFKNDWNQSINRTVVVEK